MHLSNRVKDIEPSKIRALSAKAGELAAQGKDVINLTIGQPTHPANPHALKAGLKVIFKALGLKESISFLYDFVKGKISGEANNIDTFLEKEFQERLGVKLGEPETISYTAFQGDPEIRKGIAETLIKNNGYKDIDEKNLLLTPGSNDAIRIAVKTTTDRGDKIFVPTPYYPIYRGMVKEEGGILNPIVTSKNDGYKLSPAQLEKALTEQAAGKPEELKGAIILNFPSNPTGVDYTEAELAEFLKILDKFPKLNLIGDCIYNGITEQNSEPLSLINIAKKNNISVSNRIVELFSASKEDSIPGERVGFALSTDAEAITKMSNLQLVNGSVHPSAVAQHMLLEAMRTRHQYRQQVSDFYRTRRDTFLPEVKKLGVLPPNYDSSGAFYAMLDLSSLKGVAEKTYAANDALKEAGADLKVAMYMLEKYNVAVVPGEDFGIDPNECMVRVSMNASPERLKEAAQRIGKAIEEAKGISSLQAETTKAPEKHRSLDGLKQHLAELRKTWLGF